MSTNAVNCILFLNNIFIKGEVNYHDQLGIRASRNFKE